MVLLIYTSAIQLIPMSFPVWCECAVLRVKSPLRLQLYQTNARLAKKLTVVTNSAANSRQNKQHQINCMMPIIVSFDT